MFPDTYYLFVKIYLYHRLYSITDMDQLKELEERRNAASFFMFSRLIRFHLLCSPVLGIQYQK